MKKRNLVQVYTVKCLFLGHMLGEEEVTNSNAPGKSEVDGADIGNHHRSSGTCTHASFDVSRFVVT